MRGIDCRSAPLADIIQKCSSYQKPAILVFDGRSRRFSEGKSILEAGRNDHGRDWDVIGGLLLCTEDDFKAERGCSWIRLWNFKGQRKGHLPLLEKTVKNCCPKDVHCIELGYRGTPKPKPPPTSPFCCFSSISSKNTQHVDNLTSSVPTWKIESLLSCTSTEQPAEQTILLLSGAFSPLHKAHLQCLELTRTHLLRKKIAVAGAYVCPSSDKYVKSKLGAEAMSLDERVKSSHAAVRHSNWIEILDWGLASGNEISFRLSSVLNSLGLVSNTGQKLKFNVKLVFGADFFIRSRHHFRYPMIAIGRGDEDTASLQDDIDSERAHSDFLLINVDSKKNMDISSTEIRHAVATNNTSLLKEYLNYETVKYLYPKIVSKVKVIILGIYGCSGAGKSTLASSLVSALSSPIADLSQDYWLEHEKVTDGNYETASTMDFTGFYKTLIEVKQQLLQTKVGAPIDLTIQLRGRKVSLSTGMHPSDPSTVVVVVEGFLLFHDERVTSLVDKRVVIESDLDTCRARRHKREGRKGDPADFNLFNKLVWPHYKEYLPRQRQNAGDDALTIPSTSSTADSVAAVLNFLKSS
eukprot:TRINITY_DN6626_c0_g1_i1.p1 TRINITY_DN6626_c0_g1~~TRINITY_DN6626_c0_g1_i1.p1  ORF type:complete len:580 (+),score=89.90 TRINITY_DN6626_c0_g1_i1:259-1998(+)